MDDTATQTDTSAVDNQQDNQQANNQQNQQPAWYEGLGEEAKKDPEITKYKSPDEFYKGYKNKVELLGKKGVILPGKDATPEQREEFYNALGRPKNPTEYKFSDIEGLHEGIKISPESTQAYQNISHKLGLTNEQADGLNKWYGEMLNGIVGQQEKAQQEAIQGAEAALRKEWGPKYEDNKTMVGKVASSVLSKEEIEQLGGAEGLGNNPIFNKLIHGLASKLGEDQIRNLQAAPTTSGGAESSDEAKKKISEINNMDSEARKKHPYWNENDPKHDEAVKEMSRLYKIAYPDTE